MEARTPCTAHIAGTDGWIEIDRMFYNPVAFTVTRHDGTSWRWDGTVPNGFQFEAAEVARRITAGETESPYLTLDQSIEIMDLMDTVRDQIGVVYPNER